MRKVLITEGNSPGWTTMVDGPVELKRFMLTYEPIIEFIESGGEFAYENASQWDEAKLHPLLKEFLEETQKRFGETPYIRGAVGLVVKEVEGPVFVEYHIGERLVTREELEAQWL